MAQFTIQNNALSRQNNSKTIYDRPHWGSYSKASATLNAIFTLKLITCDFDRSGHTRQLPEVLRIYTKYNFQLLDMPDIGIKITSKNLPLH